MTGTSWQEAEAGVMLWLPSAATDVMATEQSLSRLSVCEDISQSTSGSDCDHCEQYVVLPSIEDVFGQTIKYEPEDLQLSLSTLDSLRTPATYSGEETSHSDSSSSRNLYDQLRSFAAAAAASDEGRTTSISTPPTLEEYDSDRTDFLLTPRTPCPSRGAPSRPRVTGLKSHFFKSSGIAKKSKPVRRILFSKLPNGKIAKSRKPTQSLSKNVDFGSLAELQNIEQGPRRSWNDEEKHLVLIMRRWYAAETRSYTSIFNRISGLEVKDSTVNTQFADLCSWGAQASVHWQAVFDDVSFEDPTGRYAAHRSLIEATADELGVEMSLRQEEGDFNPGSAATSKSPERRREYKRRERQMKKEKKAKATQTEAIKKLSLQGPLITNERFDDQFIWEDIKDSSAESANISPKPLTRSHYIAFRVWDDETSQTIFTEETGFVAKAHSLWNGSFPPFTLEGQGRSFLMFLANSHLSMQGGGPSAFVSISTSLLQVMVKARTMSNPRIAVIDLSHPLLNEPNKTLDAAELLKMLKKEGQARWARYKGHAEKMVWGNIKSEAIICHFPLEDLQALCRSHQACAELLNLDLFQPDRRTSAVATDLRAKNTSLSLNMARAMGLIAKTFGMGEQSLVHLVSFVSTLVDGWYISTVDTHTRSSITREFATALGSQSHSAQEVMGAFSEGVELGLKNIAYYARSASRRTQIA